MTGGIFVSYRRDDSRHVAGRLVDRLSRSFKKGELFMDVDGIEPGLDFVEVLSDKVARCDVLLAIIGPQWLDARDAEGRRRLDRPDDFVRIELEAALHRNIRVVPVLVDGAQMPREQDLPPSLGALVRRHAVRLSHERFAADAEGLATSLAKARRSTTGWSWFGNGAAASAAPAAAHYSASGATAPPHAEPKPLPVGATSLASAPTLERLVGWPLPLVMAGLGALSGAASTALGADALPDLPPPLSWPSTYFALVLCIGLALRPVASRWVAWLAAFVGSQIGNYAAINSYHLTNAVMTAVLGESLKLYGIGFIAGAIGAAITAASLSAALRRLGDWRAVLAVTLVGACLGLLLGASMTSTEDSGNLFILFVPWQAGVAAAIGWLIARPSRAP